MANVEKRNLNTRPKVGDIVEVTWHDHFSFYGDLPASVPVTARTWGELANENEEGFSITQTKVMDHQEAYKVPTIHDGQFIIRGGLVEVKRIRRNKTPTT